VELWLSKLDDAANDIHDALTKADVDLYLKAGKATYEAELLEKSLDPLIALIRDEQFGPNYPVEELEVLF
jgi:CRISPR/Cas system CSM-associated protein Csm2 small subunit